MSEDIDGVKKLEKMAALKAALATASDAEVVAALVKAKQDLKDKTAAFDIVAAAVEFKIDLMVAEMLRRFEKDGTDSVRVKGLALVSKRISRVYSCGDWAVFNGWCAERVTQLAAEGKDPTDVFSFFEKRISKSEVDKYLEENAGEIPPAINVMAKITVAVTKSK